MPPAPRRAHPLWPVALALAAASSASASPPPTDAETDPAVLQPLLDAAFDGRGPRFEGIDGGVKHGDISPDGARVVTGNDSHAALWHADTGQLIALLVGDPADVRDIDFPRAVARVRFSHDGRLIARALAPRYHGPAALDLWDGRTGLPVRAVGDAMPAVLDLAFDRDDRRLVTVHPDGVRIWDVATGQRLPGPPSTRWPIDQARLSPFGDSAWIEGRRPTRRELRRTRDGRVLVEDGCAARYARFSSDGALSLCDRAQPGARLRDARTGAELKAVGSGPPHCPLPGPAYGGMVDWARSSSAVARPDAPGPAQPLICFWGDSLTLLDPRTGQGLFDPFISTFEALAGRRVLARTAAGHEVWVHSAHHHRPWRWVDLPGGVPAEMDGSGLAVGPRGRLFAAAPGGTRGTPRHLVVWDVRGRQVRSWRRPNGLPLTLTFSPDGRRLLASSGTVFDIDSGRAIELAGAVPSGRQSLGFLPDSRTVALVRRRVRWWDGEGRLLRETSPGRLQTNGIGTRYAASGARAAVSSDGLWIVETATDGAATRIVDTRWDAACRVGDLSADGDVVLVRCSRADGWRAIDPRDGRVLWRAPDDVALSDRLTFTPDGRWILVVGKTARVIDARTGASGPPVPRPGSYGGAALSPDGRWIAVGERSGHVTLWRMHPEPAPLRFAVFPDVVSQLAFTPDGRHLIIGGDRLPWLVVMPFPLTAARLKAVACANRPGWTTPGFDCEAAP